MNTPVQILKHEVLYEGRVLTLERDRVRLPGGQEGTLEVVRHHGSVVLLPMPDPAHVVLVRQYRHAVGRWLWELSAGSLEPGEDAAAGAARECEEEIGLIAGRVDLLGSFYPTPGYCDEKMNFFRITGLRKPVEGEHLAAPDADEDIETRVFALDEIGDLIARGEIEDLKTVVGLALLRTE